MLGKLLLSYILIILTQKIARWTEPVDFSSGEQNTLVKAILVVGSGDFQIGELSFIAFRPYAREIGKKKKNKHTTKKYKKKAQATNKRTNFLFDNNDW